RGLGVAQSGLARSEQWNGWLFVTPALVLLGVFMIYPILWSLWMSFQGGRGMAFSFGGFANVMRLTQDPVCLWALTNSRTCLAIQVPSMLVRALLFANALKDTKLWARSWFRTAISLPCVASLLAYSAVFRPMFAQDGIMNQMLMGLSIID